MRSFIISISVLLLVFAGCSSDDNPANVGGGGGDDPEVKIVSLSRSELRFTDICRGQAKTEVVRIIADDKNTVNVDGEVFQTRNSDFVIISGTGPYSLAPGESKEFEVEFQTTSTSYVNKTISVGIDSLSVECYGNGANDPYFSTEPGYTIRDPSSHLVVERTFGSGVSTGSPGWSNCESGSWIMNGNAITESVVEMEFEVPPGTDEIDFRVDLMGEKSCVQILLEVDDDNMWDLGTPNDCRSQFVTWSDPTAGTHTVRIGTDQALFCNSDLAVERIRITFKGGCF